MSNVNAQIQEIIQKRSETMEKVRPEQEKWNANSKVASELDREMNALRRSLENAINNKKDEKKENGKESDLGTLLSKIKTQFSDVVNDLNNKYCF